jgi:hypothetical protein
MFINFCLSKSEVYTIQEHLVFKQIYFLPTICVTERHVRLAHSAQTCLKL